MQAFQLVLRHEAATGRPFRLVYRIRLDNRPTRPITAANLAPLLHPPLSLGVCDSGDGQALMQRHLADVYFTTYR